MRPDQLNEQELQFKKRARRRLVGAIALVVLIVTVLPMILHDRTAKPQQEIAITIPSQDSGEFNSKITSVTQGATPVRTEPINEKTEKVGTDQIVEQPLSAQSSAEKDKSEPVKTEKESHPLASNTDAKQPDEKKVNESKAIPNKITEKKTIKNDAGKNGAFWVQIGVFSDPANVRQLQLKLQEQGYKSHTEKLASPKGEKIRLRLGTFTSRAEAESVLVEIKKAGLSGMVITR
jgi:DedD protein